MARKKQKLSLNPDRIRIVGLVCIFLLGAALLMMGALAFLRSSALFVVRDISLAESLQPLEVQELLKLKGQNIFDVDLARVEAKIRLKYPQLSGLRVMRRFPDQLYVTAIRRDPFAWVVLDNRNWVIDRNGFFMGAPFKDQAALTVIRGLKNQHAVAGARVSDDHVKTGLDIIAFFNQDGRLPGIVLSSVRVDDPARISCDLEKDGAVFQVIMDQEHLLQRLKTLADVLTRGGVDLEQVKYIELRFGEPVIGQKKVKK
ncbi:MAG: hypothetical protein V2A70_01165 [Candidatus Omnitrophota bacterium]